MLLHVQLDGSERITALPEFEEMVRDGTIGPETPVRADPLTRDRWIPAGALELYQGLRASPEVLVRQALASPAVPWFTALLVGIELRIFAWTQYTPVQGHLWGSLTKYTPAIIEGDEYWRLLTYGFLHGDLAHITMNMLFIAYIGIALEGVLGSVTLGVLFASSVFWGGVLSALLMPASPSVGASAGDFGLLAAAAVFGLRYSDLLPARARPRFGAAMLVYLLYLLVSGLTAERVDNWGHIGGLLAGGAQMALLRPNVGATWRARNRKISFIVVLLGGVGLVAMARLPIPLVPIEEDGLHASRPVWWTTGWAATGDRAWVSPVDGGRIVARTLHHERPTSLTESVDALLDAYREVDPWCVVRESKDVERDGVPGRHLRIAYESEGQTRRVDAEVYARGRYEHRVVLDVPEGSGRVARLWVRLFPRITLPLPEEVAASQAASGGWRALLEQAEGASDIGDLPTARARIDAARREAPGEPAPVQALLELVTLYPDASVPELTDEALTTFPADGRILEASVRALVAAGHPDLAEQRLEDRLVAAPGDRRILRLQRELFDR
ncbi:MAG: rhomboid family intramembrane serine protease [Pseudomonadota bacterium]|nr:rhomboid family intramembrane serine protease [Pseudomonadota bacterium]